MMKVEAPFAIASGGVFPDVETSTAAGAPLGSVRSSLLRTPKSAFSARTVVASVLFAPLDVIW
jgi:hypothetical protein